MGIYKGMRSWERKQKLTIREVAEGLSRIDLPMRDLIIENWIGSVKQKVKSLGTGQEKQGK